MPFESEKQRRFLWAKHPEIAKKWSKGEHTTKGRGKKSPKESPAIRGLKAAKPK